jgi:hypothetical protein
MGEWKCSYTLLTLDGVDYSVSRTRRFILEENPGCFTSEKEPLYQLRRKLSGPRSLSPPGRESRQCTYSLSLYRPNLAQHFIVMICDKTGPLIFLTLRFVAASVRVLRCTTLENLIHFRSSQLICVSLYFILSCHLSLYLFP